MDVDIPLPNKTPYFYSVLAALEKKKSPTFGSVGAWLLICDSEVQRLHAMNYVNGHEALSTYHMDFADYHPAKFERLGDQSVARAAKKVILTFIQNSAVRELAEIRTDFFPPDSTVYTKPHSYNELEFRVYNTELRMEFYLWVVRKFCLPGGAVFLGLRRREADLCSHGTL